MPDPVLLTLDTWLPADACAALVDRLNAHGFAPTGHAYPPGYRNNDRLVLDDPALAARLWPLIAPHVPATFEAAGARWRPVSLNARFRACRYSCGQSFTIHRDGAYTAPDGRRSWLTLQVYLNEGFSGGRTRFYRNDEMWCAITPRTGRAILFDHRAWHDGEPVPAGEKLVLRTDVMFERVADLSPALTRNAIGRHDGYVWRVLERADGTIVSSGRDGTVRSGRRIVYQTPDGSITGLAEDAAARLWLGLRSGSLRCPDLSLDIPCGAAVLDVLALPEGGVAAALASGDVLIVTDGTIGKRIAAHDGWAWSLAVQNGRLLSAGDDGRVHAQPLPSGDPASILDPRASKLSLRAIAASATLTLTGDVHGTVRALDPAGNPLWTVAAHQAAVTCLALRGESWASGGEDGRVCLWRGTRLEATFVCEDFVRTVAFTRDGSIVYGGYDGVVGRQTTAAYCSPPSSSSGADLGAGEPVDFSGSARSLSLGSPASGEPWILHDTRPSGAVK